MEQFSKSFTYLQKSHVGVLQPQGQRPWFGLFRFRSPLLTESHSFSIPPVTEMFHFTGYCVPFPILFRKGRLHITGARLPYSEISGSKPVCGSPKLIAAYHVLHRLLTPRHPLCALISLIPISKSGIDTGCLKPASKFAVDRTKLIVHLLKVESFQGLQDRLKWFRRTMNCIFCSSGKNLHTDVKEQRILITTVRWSECWEGDGGPGWT